MSEKEKKVLDTFAQIMPKLSENDKSYLLGLGEGMAMSGCRSEKQDKELAVSNT